MLSLLYTLHLLLRRQRVALLLAAAADCLFWRACVVILPLYAQRYVRDVRVRTAAGGRGGWNGGMRRAASH